MGPAASDGSLARVLLLAATTGYQTRSFGDAAERLGVELVYGTDRCHLIEDPWQDQAIPIRFHDEDASVAAILDVAAAKRFDGVIAVGDRPTVIAARVAQALGCRGTRPRPPRWRAHKLLTRERLRDAGLPVPWFFPVAARTSPLVLAPTCTSRPAPASSLRPSLRRQAGRAVGQPRRDARRRSRVVRRGVRAAPCAAAVTGRSAPSATTRTQRSWSRASSPAANSRSKGSLHHGALHVLAIFDKPDPLDGPFFEETIYVTPSSASPDAQDERDRAAVAERRAGASASITGRFTPSAASTLSGVFVLEVAARPIGGLCARALRST